MSIWTLTLMAVVTVLWVGMVAAVAYLAAQKTQNVPGQGQDPRLH